ncbi:MAG: diheme cytochrome c precursor [Planctomycetaceae bacterium]
MTVPPSSGHSPHRLTVMLLSAVMGVAVVGFFVGINDGVPQADQLPASTWLASGGSAAEEPASPSVDDATLHRDADTPLPAVLPAVSYADMRRRQTGPTGQWKQSLSHIPQPSYDLFAEITPSPEAKQQSTLVRASRRAYNGAPPIIPHAIEGTSDSACYACHGQGMRIADRVANRMSHGFLANCTQCHAPPPPAPFANEDLTVGNDFVGLPAPLAGERAFPGAPPTVPHSTWMREQCLACHGTEAGWAGLESSHPWRVNCQQCHAPSAVLEQGVLPASMRHE